jgi:hypothetical protein
LGLPPMRLASRSLSPFKKEFLFLA